MHNKATAHSEIANTVAVVNEREISSNDIEISTERENSMSRTSSNRGPNHVQWHGELFQAAKQNEGQLSELSHLLPTQELIDHLAERIERAYSLRHPRWWQGCSTLRVWNSAAHRLWQVHEEDPDRIPLDPELFVASQTISGSVADPWDELTGSSAGGRYRSLVYKIIDDLHCGLKKEIRLAERAIQRGREISRVLKAAPGKLSHLGCYIVARRAGRVDLANRFAAAAITQHRSCPLYRMACLELVSGELYPVGSRGSEAVPFLAPHHAISRFRKIKDV